MGLPDQSHHRTPYATNGSGRDAPSHAYWRSHTTIASSRAHLWAYRTSLTIAPHMQQTDRAVTRHPKNIGDPTPPSHRVGPIYGPTGPVSPSHPICNKRIGP